MIQILGLSLSNMMLTSNYKEMHTHCTWGGTLSSLILFPLKVFIVSFITAPLHSLMLSEGPEGRTIKQLLDFIRKLLASHFVHEIYVN